MQPTFRSEKETVLELHARKSIYEVVRRYAGSHFREIERKSGLSTGSVSYHLTYLVKKGLITEEKDGNISRYYPKEFKSENTQLLGLLRQERIRKILLFLISHENCNQEDIVEFIGLSASTVSWHLKKLVKNNVVNAIKEGRKTRYHILADKEEIINLLITYKESFLDSLVDRVIEMWEMDENKGKNH
ncbi:MAG: winged helix-turn-helix transcriptional regulator [Candidatus Altiarchaeota archaeon]